MEEEKRLEEQVTEQEAEPETTPEIEAMEQLAQEVKTCVLKSKSCGGLGNKFQEVAKELGIGFDELIDQVFEIIAR